MNILNQALTWLADPTHWQGVGGIPNRLFEHVLISAISLAIALAIALPIGLWVGHTRRHANLAVNAANIGRAVPSLAAIGIALPITVAIDPQLGFKVYPTVIGMVVLAVPPILVNAYAGLAGVDRELVEAGRGMGMRPHQLLLGVELPLAVPVIAGGIRSAAVQIVATATLGAIFGFGGLGRYLIDGYARSDNGQIWGGVVLVAGLAIATELVFLLLQRRLTPRGLRIQQGRGRVGPEPGPELAGLSRP
jgi:osmoprotectant transport system permease protein